MGPWTTPCQLIARGHQSLRKTSARQFGVGVEHLYPRTSSVCESCAWLCVHWVWVSAPHSVPSRSVGQCPKGVIWSVSDLKEVVTVRLRSSLSHPLPPPPPTLPLPPPLSLISSSLFLSPPPSLSLFVSPPSLFLPSVLSFSLFTLSVANAHSPSFIRMQLDWWSLWIFHKSAILHDGIYKVSLLICRFWHLMAVIECET